MTIRPFEIVEEEPSRCAADRRTAMVHPHGSSTFRAAQWRILLLVMFCYLFFYTGRQNFGFASGGMQADLGLTATELGAINAALLVGYGIGQAINGNLSDIYGARSLVAAGAVLSFALNWAMSLSTMFWTLLVCWGANGCVQATAWPALSRTLYNWWPRHERGKAIGFYLLAAGFSSALTYLLCILVLDQLDWRWVFRLPVTLLLVGGAAFFVLARDRPQELGFEPLPPEPADAGGPTASETSRQRYAAVLKNRTFLFACLSIGCENLARYGLLTWVPTHFLGDRWKDNALGLWLTIALPLGMAVGALTSGLIADRWFAERRTRLVWTFLGLGAVACALLEPIFDRSAAAGVAVLGLAGFLVYGPQSTYWALCPELVGRQRAGTATGLMNAVAYGFAALGQLVIGRVVDGSAATGSAFIVVATACLLGSLAILPVKK